MSVKEFIELAIKNKYYFHERETTNDVSISVTSTGASAKYMGET